VVARDTVITPLEVVPDAVLEGVGNLSYRPTPPRVIDDFVELDFLALQTKEDEIGIAPVVEGRIIRKDM
jgi:hypothetical protein